MLRVLIVDDNDHVRNVLGRLLEHHGYAVHTASGAGSAYALLAEYAVDVVLLDLTMPGIAGDALYFALVARWPYLRGRVAIMSGNLAELQGDLPTEILSCPRLAKPFTFDQLEAVIAGLTQSAERRRQNGG
jgi:DNA-binding NtrC family response regulator